MFSAGDRVVLTSPIPGRHDTCPMNVGDRVRAAYASKGPIGRVENVERREDGWYVSARFPNGSRVSRLIPINQYVLVKENMSNIKINYAKTPAPIESVVSKATTSSFDLTADTRVRLPLCLMINGSIHSMSREDWTEFRNAVDEMLGL